MTVLKRREFRKDLFQDEARRLGALLAERMEDKEGWHGVERQERLEDWGSLSAPLPPPPADPIE